MSDFLTKRQDLKQLLMRHALELWDNVHCQLPRNQTPDSPDRLDWWTLAFGDPATGERVFVDAASEDGLYAEAERKIIEYVSRRDLDS